MPLRGEIERAISQMKNEKAPGEDGIAMQRVEAGREPAIKISLNYSIQ